MAFFQYLVFDGENLPLPDSYEVELEDVEADSGGETEAGTTQRDVVRHGVARIPVSFSVTAKWLKKLAGYAKKGERGTVKCKRVNNYGKKTSTKIRLQGFWGSDKGSA